MKTICTTLAIAAVSALAMSTGYSIGIDDPPPTSVPDGGSSLVLLLVAMLGLGLGVVRKLTK